MYKVVILFVALISLFGCKKEDETKKDILTNKGIWEIEEWVFRNDNIQNWSSTFYDVDCSLDDVWEFRNSSIQQYSGSILCSGQSGTLDDSWPYRLTANDTKMIITINGFEFEYNILELNENIMILDYSVGDVYNSIGRITFR